MTAATLRTLDKYGGVGSGGDGSGGPGVARAVRGRRWGRRLGGALAKRDGRARDRPTRGTPVVCRETRLHDMPRAKVHEAPPSTTATKLGRPHPFK